MLSNNILRAWEYVCNGCQVKINKMSSCASSFEYLSIIYLSSIDLSIYLCLTLVIITFFMIIFSKICNKCKIVLFFIIIKTQFIYFSLFVFMMERRWQDQAGRSDWRESAQCLWLSGVLPLSLEETLGKRRDKHGAETFQKDRVERWWKKQVRRSAVPGSPWHCSFQPTKWKSRRAPVRMPTSGRESLPCGSAVNTWTLCPRIWLL